MRSAIPIETQFLSGSVPFRPAIPLQSSCGIYRDVSQGRALSPNYPPLHNDSRMLLILTIGREF